MPGMWQVLQESFDPIIDEATKENLLLMMTKAEVKGEHDYRGMYTALLTHQGKAVCAAVFRAFGAQLAEVPLVATKNGARRQGHFRVLMNALEFLLEEVRDISARHFYRKYHAFNMLLASAHLVSNQEVATYETAVAHKRFVAKQN